MSSGSHPWTHQTLATLAILAGIGHLITRFRAAGICVYDITQTRSLKLRVCWCSGLNVFNAVRQTLVCIRKTATRHKRGE